MLPASGLCGLFERRTRVQCRAGERPRRNARSASIRTQHLYLLPSMTEISQVLHAIERGDPQAAEQLLPLVYDGLRKLAAGKLAHEKPGQTLQPTALVHEAYLRLVGDGEPHWDGRGHFFAAAAEAMRRILVDHARQRAAQKRGGGARRVEWDDGFAAADGP